MIEGRELDLRKAASPEIFGRRCGGCQNDLDFVYFRRDSSMRDGHAVLCYDCEASPRLSTAEHTANLREKNYNASQKQRWEHQDELVNDESRVGRSMHSSELLRRLKKLVPCLFFRDGNIAGDIAVFQTFGVPQPELEGRTFKYLWYIPTGMLKEFSTYEFNDRGVVVRENERGWRTPLLRLIKANLLTEQQCNKEFGNPTSGVASNRWFRELSKHRQRKEEESKRLLQNVQF